MMFNDAGMVKAKHVRSLAIARSGKLTCWRCGGSGIYHTYGKCFRCDGSGVDPQQPKHPEKSKRMRAQREWAARFDADGNPIAKLSA